MFLVTEENDYIDWNDEYDENSKNNKIKEKIRKQNTEQIKQTERIRK